MEYSEKEDNKNYTTIVAKICTNCCDQVELHVVTLNKTKQGYI